MNAKYTMASAALVALLWCGASANAQVLGGGFAGNAAGGIGGSLMGPGVAAGGWTNSAVGGSLTNSGDMFGTVSRTHDIAAQHTAQAVAAGEAGVVTMRGDANTTAAQASSAANSGAQRVTDSAQSAQSVTNGAAQSLDVSAGHAVTTGPVAAADGSSPASTATPSAEPSSPRAHASASAGHQSTVAAGGGDPASPSGGVTLAGSNSTSADADATLTQ
jgi:hypothetical protein